LLERAGDVIPYVVQVVLAKRPDGSEPFTFPSTCPACKGRTERAEGEAYWRCTNTACPAQFKERLRHFGSRRAMDIEHLGDSTIEQLVDTGAVKDFADLYHLTADQVAALDRFADKSAENLIRAIDTSRERGLARLLNALGIRLVGERVAQLLAGRFGSLDVIKAKSETELAEVHGIGDEIARAIVTFFQEPRNVELIDRLKAAGVVVGAPLAPVGPTPLIGKTFVVTGTLPTLSREAARELIERHGGRVASSVSKKTSYVVVGEAPGSKADDARRLGVAVLDEAGLLELVRA
jgi:DNA ligase (NAD+)